MKKAAHEAGLEKLARPKITSSEPVEPRSTIVQRSRDNQASWAFTFSTMLAKAAGS
jgi:hypothetical protein